MNKVLLSGRLAADTSLATTPTGIKVCAFKLAVSRRNNKDIADFIDCAAFGSTAEYIVNYCAKGDTLIVEGRWETGSFTKKDGTKVYTDKCIVDILEKATFKREIKIEEGDYLKEPEDEEEKEDEETIELTEDDLPF